MTRWNSKLVNQCQAETQLNFLTEQSELTEFQQDFGRIRKNNHLNAVVIPHSLVQLSQLLKFSHKHALPLTLRSLGLSQSGQSIPVEGGLAVDLSQFNQVTKLSNSQITVGAGVRWRDLCRESLSMNSVPYVVPYNTYLNVAGLFSSGGLGAATFKYGIAANYAEKMTVMLSNGELVNCQKGDQLHQAVLSGMGQFGIICDATINLRPCKQNVKSFYLLFDNYQDWIDSQYLLTEHIDYLEAYTVPGLLGLKNTTKGRRPLINWQFCIHCGFEYDGKFSPLQILQQLKGARLIHSESNTMYDFIVRHDNRFKAMKQSGKWMQKHPWFECYVPKEPLLEHLPLILEKLPLALGGLYHIYPVAAKCPKYFMMPQAESILSFNMLTQGISDNEEHQCLEALGWLHDLIISLGGKRYVSGWLGSEVEETFWQQHYGDLYNERLALKQHYDPKNILCSKLLPNEGDRLQP